jgi:hypothetical protein
MISGLKNIGTELLAVIAAFTLLIHPERGSCQHPENYLQPSDMKQDLVWLQRKILLYHPACRDSIRYDSVNGAFENAFYEAEKPMQELPFLRLLRKTLNSLRCGHSTAIPSRSFYRYFEKARPKPLFPLQVSWHDSLMQVRFNGSDDPAISVGEKITSINQESIEELSSSMMEFLPGDGYHESFRRYHLSLNFPTYYLFLRGPYYYFQTSFEGNSGRKKTRTLSLRSYGKPVSRVLPNRSNRVILHDHRDRDLSALRSNSTVACLRIGKFRGKTGWYKKAFQRLSKEKFQTLILDLRGNSGGNLFEANQLLSYLLPDTFSMKFIRRPGPFMFSGRSNLSLKERISMLIFRLLPSRKQKKGGQTFREGELWCTRFLYHPVRQHGFQGKIIVLLDGGTFSSASYVAAMLRKHGRAILAGEESGGGAAGCNAVIVPMLTLPETRLRVSMPLYYLDHESGDVSFRGLIPEIRLPHPDPAMLLRGTDTGIEWLIRQQRAVEK